MSPSLEQVERLITRYLDGECSPDERELMDRLMSEDAEVRTLFEEYEVIDREIRLAVRQALSRGGRRAPLRSRWRRAGKALAVAAAACLALLAWLRQGQQPAPAAGNGAHQAGAVHANRAGGSPLPADLAGDMIRTLPPAYERPELRVRGTQRDWIVIPGERSGTYLIIEVDRSRTHHIGVHRDF
jgi:hypothetical protein